MAVKEKYYEALEHLFTDMAAAEEMAGLKSVKLMIRGNMFHPGN